MNKEELKETFGRISGELERAAYAYAQSCDIGEERTIAFEMYEEIRTMWRRHHE